MTMTPPLSDTIITDDAQLCYMHIAYMWIIFPRNVRHSCTAFVFIVIVEILHITVSEFTKSQTESECICVKSRNLYL